MYIRGFRPRYGEGPPQEVYDVTSVRHSGLHHLEYTSRDNMRRSTVTIEYQAEVQPTMNVILSAETQQLLDERMKKAGFASADDALRFALQTLEQLEAEDLDDDTLAAIEEGLSQANRGEGKPWEIVRAELRAKYIAE